jgi:hypothetical protein
MILLALGVAIFGLHARLARLEINDAFISAALGAAVGRRIVAIIHLRFHGGLSPRRRLICTSLLTYLGTSSGGGEDFTTSINWSILFHYLNSLVTLIHQNIKYEFIHIQLPTS